MRPQSTMKRLALVAAAMAVAVPAHAQALTACKWGSPGYSWAMKTPEGTKIATGISGDVILYSSLTLSPGKVIPVGNFWSGLGYNWVGDFNGDGFDDIASANGSTVEMRLQTNNVPISECRREVVNGQSLTKRQDYKLSGFQKDSLQVSGSVRVTLFCCGRPSDASPIRDNRPSYCFRAWSFVSFWLWPGSGW